MWPSYRKVKDLDNNSHNGDNEVASDIEQKGIKQRLQEVVNIMKEMDELLEVGYEYYDREKYKILQNKLDKMILYEETYDKFWEPADLDAIFNMRDHKVAEQEQLLESWFKQYNIWRKTDNKLQETIKECRELEETTSKFVQNIMQGESFSLLYENPQHNKKIDMQQKLTFKEYSSLYIGTPVERYTLLFPKDSIFYHGVRGKSIMYDDVSGFADLDIDELIDDGVLTSELVKNTKLWLEDLKSKKGYVEYYKSLLTRIIRNNNIRKLFLSNLKVAQTYGKLGVIAFESTRHLRLVDMSSPDVVRFFASIAPEEVSFDKAFFLTRHLQNDNFIVVRRKSFYHNDKVVIEWLCNQFPKYGIDGYYYKGTDFHEEIMVCDPLRTIAFHKFIPATKFERTFE